MVKEVEYTEQVKHNAPLIVPHHLSTGIQPIPKPTFSPVYILGMMSHDMEYSLGLSGSVVLPVSPPNFLCPSTLLTGRTGEAGKSLM